MSKKKNKTDDFGISKEELKELACAVIRTVNEKMPKFKYTENNNEEDNDAATVQDT